MSLNGRRPLLLLLVLAVVAGSGAEVAVAAEVRPAKPAAATRTTDRPSTTTVVQSAMGTDRSAPVTVLLVGVGAVVGVIVGIIPALMVAMLLGYVPQPRLGRRGTGVLVDPARATVLPPDLRGDLAGPPFAASASVAPAPVALAVAQDSSDVQPPPNPLGILAHARHQSVYDAAYAEQLERVEALRAAIGGRLRGRPEPPSE